MIRLILIVGYHKVRLTLPTCSSFIVVDTRWHDLCYNSFHLYLDEGNDTKMGWYSKLAQNRHNLRIYSRIEYFFFPAKSDNPWGVNIGIWSWEKISFTILRKLLRNGVWGSLKLCNCLSVLDGIYPNWKLLCNDFMKSKLILVSSYLMIISKWICHFSETG